MAADESTISWGPSPTFGELVSGSLPGGQSRARAPESRRKEECARARLCSWCMQACSAASAFKDETVF